MKMNQFKLLKISSLFLFILVATQSCMVSSLHPLYSRKDRVYEEKLNGEWIDEDGTKYEVSTIAEEKLSQFEDHQRELLKLNSADSIQVKEQLLRIEIILKSLNKLKDMPGFKVYHIRVIEKNDTTVFLGRLSKLDNYYFLDVIPDEDSFEKKLDNDYLISLVAPMHGFLKLKFKDNRIILNAIEYDDFEKLIQEKKIRIEHISRGDRIIITDKTSSIQKFLLKFADTSLFNNPKNALILKSL